MDFGVICTTITGPTFSTVNQCKNGIGPVFFVEICVQIVYVRRK